MTSYSKPIYFYLRNNYRTSPARIREFPLMKQLLLLTLITGLFASTLLAQEDNWDVYLAQYEKGAGSTVLNMGLYATAPNKAYAYLLIVTVPFKECKDGFPLDSQLTELYRISDSLERTITNTQQNVFAGTFTYQCEREHYFYLHDTTRVRKALTKMCREQFAAIPVRIKIKPDPSWDNYLHFLYPNEETRDYMADTKVVMSLGNAGDKLEKARKVDHWLYFSSEADRSCFTTYLAGKGFKVESTEKVNKKEKPYSLQISRTDKVNIDNIHPIIRELRKHAKLCKGDYDGWETLVVTD